MAVRRDTVQLNVEVITDEQRNLAKTNTDTKGLVQELRKVVREGGDVADVMRRIAEAGGRVEDIDLTQVAPAQLITRARQLKQILDQLPSSAPQAAKLRDEYKRINDRLADIRQQTRGVAQAFSSGRGGVLGSLSGMASRVTGIVVAVGAALAAFRGLFSFISRGVESAAAFEQLNVSLETFLGSAEKAREVLEDLTEFSVRTPFEPEQVNRAGRALLAFGVQQEDLISTLTRVGDVASGTGKDFNELALIYGKALTSGRIQGEELNQLAEAGIPIYEELGKVLGVNSTEIRKLGEQGRLSFDALDAVFQNLTAEGGRFNGLLEKQSTTLTGLASTARGAFSALGRNFAEAFTPLLRNILPPVIALINRITERVGPLAAAIGERLVTAFQFLRRIFTPLVQSVRRLATSLANTASGAGVFAAAIQTLGAALAVVSGVVANVITVVSNLFETFSRFGGGAGGIIQRVFIDPIRLALGIITLFLAGLNGLVSASRVAFEEIGKFGDIFADTIGLAFNKLKGLFVDNERVIFENEQRLAARYRNLGKSIGDAFQQGYNDALGNGPDLGADAGAGSGSGSGGGITLPLPDKPPTQAEIDKAAKEAARIAALVAERAGDQPVEAIETNTTITPLTDEEEIARAEALAQKLGDIDEQLLQRRIDLAEREAQVRRELSQLAIDTATESTDAIIELLGRNEEARKKNAGIIKAFQKGQVIVTGLNEIAQIRAATAVQAKSAGAAAPLVLALGAVRTAAAIARTAATVGKIEATQFARGGTPKFGKFGGRPHSAGGVNGYFDDGTQINVERDETFAIVNKNARGLLGFLSGVNQATGGVPFFRGGGIALNAPDLSPRLSPGALSVSSAPAADNSELVEEMRMTRTAIQAQRLSLSYTQIEDVASDVALVRSESEV